MSALPSIAHLVNPVRVDGTSDLFWAQPITFASMRRAREVARAAGVSVALYTAQYAEDRVSPDGFMATAELVRSVLDCGEFAIARKLPLVGDLLDRLRTADAADVLIWTNVDIALQPDFYVRVAEWIAAGHDALTINRRTVVANPAQARDLDWLSAQPGEPHPGHDCFVFRRHIAGDINLGALCTGFPPVGLVLLATLSTVAPRFSTFSDQRLTFHINGDRQWRDARFDDYWRHNRDQALRILAALRTRAGSLSREALNILDYIERTHSLAPGGQ